MKYTNILVTFEISQYELNVSYRPYLQLSDFSKIQE